MTNSEKFLTQESWACQIMILFLFPANRKQEQLFRYCQFIQADENGKLLENGKARWFRIGFPFYFTDSISRIAGSSTGSLRDVVTGRADFGFMFRNIATQTDLVRISNLIHNEDAVVGHYVNQTSKHSLWINFEALSMFAPSLGFFFEYVSMLVLVFLFAYLLGRYRKERRPWQFPVRLFYSLFSPEYPAFSRCSAVGALFLSILLFLFLVKQIIGNNIKTEVGP